MEDDLKTKWKMTSKKMEDDLKKNGRQPQKNEKMEDDHKYNLKKATLIGCDIIVNSPSSFNDRSQLNFVKQTQIN